jgi:protein-tyrosine phosphatase
MVCLGNICRSPLAEGILQKKLKEYGLDQQVTVDSCGTNGLHDGEHPDPRTLENARQNKVYIDKLVSRQFIPIDLWDFDRVYCMDSSNYANVMAAVTKEEHKEKVSMILNESRPGSNMDVPDPYYGGEDGFQTVFDLLDEACTVIADGLK